MRRTGITIVEILVAIGIIGILLALLVPAVQAARESARLLHCKNNLHQLGIAFEGHVAQQRKFPAGKISPIDNPNLGELSWLGQLLPYLDQSRLYANIQDAYAASPSPFVTPPHSAIAFPVQAFQCPTDWRVRGPQSASSRGGGYVALTSYLGVSGIDHQADTGVLYFGSQTAPKSILDGLSSTLLVGERPPSSDYNFGWWYTGVGQDGRGNADLFMGVNELPADSGRLSHCPPGSFRPGSPDQLCDALNFWSMHSGGANFLFCDGHVDFISFDAATLEPIATRAGRELPE
jgi:prepilin-type processing-associated H-X9-DG protein